MAAMLFILAAGRPATATMGMYKVYVKEYIDVHPDQAYAADVKKANVRCLLCHQGKKRKNCNALGIEMAKFVKKGEDCKDVEKISASLKTILAMRVDPKDENSETFADRIAASKWPAGELEDLKKEPVATSSGAAE
jgi:hypothetical protein